MSQFGGKMSKFDIVSTDLRIILSNFVATDVYARSKKLQIWWRMAPHHRRYSDGQPGDGGDCHLCPIPDQRVRHRLLGTKSWTGLDPDDRYDDGDYADDDEVGENDDDDDEVISGEEGGIADSDRARIFCKFVSCRAGDCQISNVIVF